MHRIDGRHDAGRTIRPVKLTRLELVQLLEKLEVRDLNLAQFTVQLSKFPQLTKRLLQLANSAGTGKSQEITDPAVAASWLGSRRIHSMLMNLPPEWLEDEVQAA